MAFAGFPASAVDFLRGIAANNSRPWYEAHRSTYESAWLTPARDFVVEVADALRPDVPEIGAEPKVNGSIIRLQRDTRFSHDKRPYKDHLDLWWWVGGATERHAPGFFFRLTAERLYLGGGSHGFEDPLLLRYRRAIGDGDEGEHLTGLLAELRREGGWQFAEAALKRVPAPYAQDHPHADLLRYRSMFALVDLAHPPELASADLVDLCVTRFLRVAPLVGWLANLSRADPAE